MHVDDDLEAGAAEAAGIDILTCEVDGMLARIRGAAPRDVDDRTFEKFLELVGDD